EEAICPVKSGRGPALAARGLGRVHCASAAPFGSQIVNVLLITAEKSEADRVAALLRAMPLVCGVRETRTAHEALNAIEVETFDCIFIDRPLPGADAELVLAAASVAGVPTVALACADEAACEAAIGAGADDALAGWPPDPRALGRCLRGAARLAEARRSSVELAERLQCCEERLHSLEREVSTDVTARKQAEETLRISEEQYRASFELAAVGQVHTEPASGRFLRVNRRFCEMVGYSADELLQMNFLDLTAPEDMPVTHETLARTMADGTPQYEIDKRYIRKDGRTIRVSINATFVRDASGRPTRRLAVVQDITEQQRAEEALRESEDRFRRLVDQSPDAIFVISDEGRFVNVNRAACQSLGYTREELLQLGVFDIDLNVTSAGVPALWERIRDGAAITIDGMHRRRDGSTFPVEVRLAAIETGGEVMVLALARDVTERLSAARRTARLLEQVIGAQEEERRRVARELHDETGQALTSLLVGLRTLEDVPTLDAARASARGLRTLAARAMEDVRRLAGGLRPSALDDLGLTAALERYATEYAQTHGVAVRLEGAGPGLGRLPAATETAVYRIAQEALTNVARHAGARHARISFERGPGSVRMLVEDDGHGFDVEHALRAADATGSIGLHSMRERASLLGGRFTIESVPGDGTTLTLEIPVDDARGPAIPMSD
ncbi:MAG: putative Response regulator/sensory box histidine kinase, partial [Phycisphaerales bacterium]|nr:putative Response regulator/sensory box histidine kinase [Phycisphaerales bacterium]